MSSRERDSASGSVSNDLKWRIRDAKLTLRGRAREFLGAWSFHLHHINRLLFFYLNTLPPGDGRLYYLYGRQLLPPCALSVRLVHLTLVSADLLYFLLSYLTFIVFLSDNRMVSFIPALVVTFFSTFLSQHVVRAGIVQKQGLALPPDATVNRETVKSIFVQCADAYLLVNVYGNYFN